MSRPIPIARPLLGPEEQAAVLGPLQTGWVAQGPEVRRFEGAVARFTEAPWAVACASATAGLHMALAALGVGPGDEVIVPAFTWISTASAARFLGATPIFCDIDLDTFNLDLQALPGCASPRTKAVIPVHLFGRPVDMDAFGAALAAVEIAAGHPVAVIEDAACALGTTWGSRHVGRFGEIGVFSFHPRKIITTGEGGMLIGAGDHEGALRALRDHGASVDVADRQRGGGAQIRFDTLGFNYRMTDLQGALGAAQMDRLDEIIAARAEQARRYDEGLRDLPWLQRPTAPEGGRHSWQAYVCLMRTGPHELAHVEAQHQARQALMAALAAQDIATRPGTHAVHALGLYRDLYDLTPAHCPRAWIADRLSLALPLFPGLTPADQDRVIEALRRHRPDV